ncbi:helix-turn-helix domain-containing protein [Magnetospirillum gryphiswaldense]|uniref:DNA-bindingPredicted transcriptional regulator n=2 Tax=Magnetospirillum gryphiswaldense TaxID=55518 RepID=V6EWB7_MAGGM|nr:helix-turn-helix transcriptional regulator [Magnetospirillum gryphiswaldense]AVM74531.1 anaerobic benzoate catabolism transcriptional regulator [Magnetospirillum gryphiswaldense MSR-1]AVM78434.1 anaerobic benzoate catabolism transcriptional regulator [Magnetospirillum gryphiswaldense]CAM74466.1 transcriptional regulator [Magnetospirillum gryphiswaldense MSR-1]CDK97372.1 DNA-binding;Predicted transcriptional regulator [Magnetospirillum gryphiswaldense MSR-1 v2]
MATETNSKRIYRARTESGDPDPIDTHVGARLRLRRTLMGLSQTELAKSVGLTFQQVQKYESGANRISASRLYHISEALDVPVSFFFDDMSRSSGKYGLHEDAVAFSAPESSREGLEMMRNYHRITDEAIRRSVYDLTKSLAAKLNGEEE